VYNFSSAKKMASVLVRHSADTLRLYNKGAAEWVLQRCSSVADGSGNAVPLTQVSSPPSHPPCCLLPAVVVAASACCLLWSSLPVPAACCGRRCQCLTCAMHHA
jgi:magnesium-transporting ATPase (P-type)